MLNLIKISSICLILSFVSCSGGGGGDDSESDNKNLPKTGARVIHGSIDAPPFNISVGTTSLSTTSFAATSGYTSLTAGTAGFVIKRANTEEIISSPSLSINEGERKSILFADDYRDGSARSFELNDNPGDLNAGFAKVRIINAVQGLRGVEAVVAGNAGEIISLGTASAYVEVPAGIVTFSATSQLGGVASGSFTVEEKKPYSILVTGDWGYFITTNLLLG